MKRVGVIVALAGLVLLGTCGKSEQHPIKHGVVNTDSCAIVWVAIDGDIKLLLVTDNPLDYTDHENWDGTEFNVFYELRYANKRVPVFVYGDVETGIATAAYDNEPLDLGLGTCFDTREGFARALTSAEKIRYVKQVPL